MLAQESEPEPEPERVPLERPVRQAQQGRGPEVPAGAGGAACAFPPPSTKARMSFFVTRPLRPLP